MAVRRSTEPAKLNGLTRFAMTLSVSMMASNSAAVSDVFVRTVSASTLPADPSKAAPQTSGPRPS